MSGNGGYGKHGLGGRWEGEEKFMSCENNLGVECRTLLANISLQVNVVDKWLWNQIKNGEYIVKNVYNE